MDPLSQARFDKITAKGISSITDTDREFLRARESYLTEEQKVLYFGSKEKKPADDKLARYRELMKQAKEMNLDVPKGMKLDQLALFIAEHS